VVPAGPTGGDLGSGGKALAGVLEVGVERLDSAVARVHVQNGQALAGADTDVRLGLAAPPLLDRGEVACGVV